MGKNVNPKYIHSLNSGILKVEIRGERMELLYKNKINLRDKIQMNLFFSILENYGNFSITEILKSKIKEDWI